jgi:hypothetical protein
VTHHVGRLFPAGRVRLFLFDTITCDGLVSFPSVRRAIPSNVSRFFTRATVAASDLATGSSGSNPFELPSDGVPPLG